MPTELEQKIGYTFADRSLLEKALTHASMQSIENNERLEFLGDRVLGIVIAGKLFREYPHENEGKLAKRHTALVQQIALVSVARNIGLSDYLRLSPGEVKAGGLANDTILSDAMEALLGAVFIDGGYAAAEKIVLAQWQKLSDAQLLPPEDPKTQLQEWVQHRGLPLPVYSVVGKTGSDHAPMFTVEVLVYGFGTVAAEASSKRAAEKEAAARMLLKVGKN